MFNQFNLFPKKIKNSSVPWSILSKSWSETINSKYTKRANYTVIANTKAQDGHDYSLGCKWEYPGGSGSARLQHRCICQFPGVNNLCDHSPQIKGLVLVDSHYVYTVAEYTRVVRQRIVLGGWANTVVTENKNVNFNPWLCVSSLGCPNIKSELVRKQLPCCSRIFLSADHCRSLIKRKWQQEVERRGICSS